MTARSTLIRQCLQLEDDLDRMKLTLGLPTETAIDVDLTELEQLTLRDMIEVNREQARSLAGRACRRCAARIRQPTTETS